jgi:cytochrome c
VPKVLLFLLMVIASPVSAAGDSEAGRLLAERSCGGCHTVGEARGTDTAPPFRSIARDPAKSDSYLYAWLTDPHPPMPNLSLTRREIADVMAYLASLRAP